MGMNCVKCGTELPQTGAYCPTCGAPRREFEHLARQTERAVSQVLASGGEALGRAAKEFQPTFDRAVEALRPAVEVLERATDDVLLEVRPAVEATARVAKEFTDKTVAAVRPAVTRARERTGHAVHTIREKVWKR